MGALGLYQIACLPYSFYMCCTWWQVLIPDPSLNPQTWHRAQLSRAARLKGCVIITCMICPVNNASCPVLRTKLNKLIYGLRVSHTNTKSTCSQADGKKEEGGAVVEGIGGTSQMMSAWLAATPSEIHCNPQKRTQGVSVVIHPVITALGRWKQWTQGQTGLYGETTWKEKR